MSGKQKIDCEHHGLHSETMELPCAEDGRGKDLFCAKCISEFFTISGLPKVKKAAIKKEGKTDE